MISLGECAVSVPLNYAECDDFFWGDWAMTPGLATWYFIRIELGLSPLPVTVANEGL